MISTVSWLHFAVLGIEKNFRFKYNLFCVISNINFDGNKSGKLNYTRHIEIPGF